MKRRLTFLSLFDGTPWRMDWRRESGEWTDAHLDGVGPGRRPDGEREMDRREQAGEGKPGRTGDQGGERERRCPASYKSPSSRSLSISLCAAPLVSVGHQKRSLPSLHPLPPWPRLQPASSALQHCSWRFNAPPCSTAAGAWPPIFFCIASGLTPLTLLSLG